MPPLSGVRFRIRPCLAWQETLRYGMCVGRVWLIRETRLRDRPTLARRLVLGSAILVSSLPLTHADVKNVSTEEIIVAFVVSTVGFSLFLFGRKQRRVPQYVVGMLMMASPMIVLDPVWASVSALVMLIGMRVAIGHGI